MEEKYQQVVKGWMPRKALLDFKEDLNEIRSASRPKTDVGLVMPVPALVDHSVVTVDASSSKAELEHY